MQTRFAFVAILGSALLLGAAMAQAPAAAKTSAKPAAEDTAESDAVKPAETAEPGPPSVPAKSKTGDILTLVDGTVVDGVQIVRVSPKEYVVEIIEGVTLAIPRNQVKSVKQDNISSLDLRKMRAQAAARESSSLIPGMQFAGKLTEDISKPPKTFVNEDLQVVLEQMGERAGVQVVIDESVNELPPAERTWSYRCDGNERVTLFSLLKDELPKRFPDLEALYHEDKVIVATKEAVPALKEKGATEIPGPDEVEAAAAAPGPAEPPAPVAPGVPPAPTAAAGAAAPAVPPAGAIPPPPAG